MIYSCSGGSNVGQVANEAARILAERGRGKMACLAGIGGHVSGMIESAKAAKNIIAIDGCPVRCAIKTLEQAGLAPDLHIIVTDFDVRKSYDLTVSTQVVERVARKIESRLR